MNQFDRPESPPWFITHWGLFYLAIALFLAAIRFLFLVGSPEVFFLEDGSDSSWIINDEPFDLFARSKHPGTSAFRCEFSLKSPVERATLSICAFRRCSVWIDPDPNVDSPPIYSSPPGFDSWRTRQQVKLPSPLAAGRHSIYVNVENKAAPPCFRADCQKLGLTTTSGWQSRTQTDDWRPARRASIPALLPLADQYPTIVSSLSRTLPWLVVVFAAVFVSVYKHGGTNEDSRLAKPPILTARRVRFGLLIVLFAISINNLAFAGERMGYDAKQHMEYVKFVVDHHTLPLATDGWQMFQSPLFYILAAPWYALFNWLECPMSSTKLLRFIPNLCGLLQLEIGYRASRKVFPDDNDSQIVGTVICGLMPMNVYLAQFVSNEPLSGCLTSLTVLYCLNLLLDSQPVPNRWRYLILGTAWGLSLLAKVTSILMAPLLVIVIIRHCWRFGTAPIRIIEGWAITFGTAFLVAGWYYIRNWIYLGRPFVGGWDRNRGYDWWQDPGYRTWSQVLSFGTCLNRPAYSGRWSLWDAIYSSMWADGFLSGSVGKPDIVSWNVDWMNMGVWLALIPFACLFVGVATCYRSRWSRVRDCLVFSVVMISTYLLAICDLWIRLPVYSTAKATYMIGALPCFGLLIAAGAAQILRYRVMRSMFYAFLSCWVLTVCLTFFTCKTPVQSTAASIDVRISAIP